MSDSKFFEMFLVILVFLIAFTMGVFGFVDNIPDSSIAYVTQTADPDEAMVERLQKVGQVRLASAANATAEAESAAAESAAGDGEATGESVAVASVERSGETVYNQACVACHGAGIAGAPAYGDAEGWTARIAQGNEMLTQRAIEGYMGDAGFMPAKGGRMDLSDAEVAAAVDYMVAGSQ